MGGSGGFVFTIYFFLASWLRRWRQRPAAPAALPIYQAERAAFPPPPPPAPGGKLEDRLHRENPSLHRLYRRVVEYCERYGVCTAANRTLGADWYGRGEPFHTRSVQRLLARLVELGAIEILELPQDQIRTGRAIRLPSDVPAQQLQLRLGDARPRRLTPREVEQGRADPPAPGPERRRPPEQPSGRSPGVTSAPPVTATDVTRDMSPDLGSGSGSEESSPRDRDRREREEGFAPAGKEAASPVATDGTPVFSLEERRAYHERAGERRSRWTETFLPLEQHHLPHDVCRKLLDAIPEKRRSDGKLLGYLYATLEEREQAAGRLPLPRAPAPRAAASPVPVAEPDLPDLPLAPPVCHEAAAAWAQLRTHAVVGDDACASIVALYIDQLVPVALAGGVLTLWAPNRFIRNTVEERFAVSEVLAAQGRTLRWILGDDPPSEASA